MSEFHLQYYGLEFSWAITFPETLYMPSEELTHCVHFITQETNMLDFDSSSAAEHASFLECYTTLVSKSKKTYTSENKLLEMMF
jgi:hypothetical protein